MPPKVKIVIVDDHPVVVQGLKALLERNFEVSAAFGSGEELMEYLVINKADLILLDISLPDCSGIDLCLKIKKKNPETAVLMLSNRSERSSIMQALQNGASGYLQKNASVEVLLKSISEAHLGNIVFDDEVKKIMSKPSENLAELPKLTRREKEILKHLSLGKTTAVIAEELFLSPLTVETHRKNLLQKFGAKNSAEMVKTAADLNLI